jgi:cob(I)alamin adenosyltransferase
VPKYDPRPEATGTVDEANAALGMARALCQHPHSRELILGVQRDLYHLMAELSATPENAARFRTIDAGRVTWLEGETDRVGKQVEMPPEFIVPGDSLAGAALDLARAIVRRAERRVARLVHSGELENGECLRYLNRLSSLCFVLELLENQAAGNALPTLAKQ